MHFIEMYFNPTVISWLFFVGLVICFMQVTFVAAMTLVEWTLGNSQLFADEFQD